MSDFSASRPGSPAESWSVVSDFGRWGARRYARDSVSDSIDQEHLPTRRIPICQLYLIILNELASAVKQRRLDMGLSQQRLAELSNLSRATINELET